MKLKTRTPDYTPLLKDSGEFSRVMQPLIGLKIFQTDLNAQPMTALGTTGTDNGTTTSRTLANKKTVRTLASHHGGLISAFHVKLFSTKIKARNYTF